MWSFNGKVIVLLLIAKSSLISASTPTPVAVTSSDHLIDDESHDPFKNICKFHSGEYYRETSMKVVCCGNDTLQLPDVLVHDQRTNKVYEECSKKFKEDDTSDFPTGLWKAFLCKLKQSNVFKAVDKMTFEELMTFITKLYPDTVKADLKKLTTKCAAIDSEKVEDHVKIQKYMECYYEAENTTCHKPYGEIENHDGDLKKTKELGCPVVPGLMFASSIEYCCKKRSTPYPILEFPGNWHMSEETWNVVENCRSSFAQREMELMPEAFKVSTPKTDDGEDHQMHTTWDVMCHSACVLEQKNYTKDMLKLEPDRVIEMYTHDFGKAMTESLSDIIKKRKNKEKVFLAMELDTENSKPMDFPELSAKFEKASEKEKIQYFCKFVDTINFEERRALHEYCFDEKYGNEWGDQHHSYFVPQH